MSAISEIRIKNMVCDRCIKVVRQKLEEQDLPVQQIELGRVQFDNPVEIDNTALAKILEEEGFELIDDETSSLISKIKISKNIFLAILLVKFSRAMLVIL